MAKLSCNPFCTRRSLRKSQDETTLIRDNSMQSLLLVLECFANSNVWSQTLENNTVIWGTSIALGRKQCVITACFPEQDSSASQLQKSLFTRTARLGEDIWDISWPWEVPVYQSLCFLLSPFAVSNQAVRAPVVLACPGTWYRLAVPWGPCHILFPNTQEQRPLQPSWCPFSFSSREIRVVPHYTEGNGAASNSSQPRNAPKLQRIHCRLTLGKLCEEGCQKANGAELSELWTVTYHRVYQSFSHPHKQMHNPPVPGNPSEQLFSWNCWMTAPSLQRHKLSDTNLKIWLEF